MMKKDVVGSVHIELNLDRITGNLDRAQIALNQQIVKDCEPHIPLQQGALRNSVSFPEGASGHLIQWGNKFTPYAHYQYMGEVYGPNIPIKDAEGNITGWWSPPGESKHPTGRKLQYHEPGTGAKWFELAKAEHLPEWKELVKRKLVE